MRNSKILVADGVFVGAAVLLPDQAGWRIVASDDRIAAVDGRVVTALPEAERLVRQTFLSGRGNLPTAKLQTA